MRKRSQGAGTVALTALVLLAPLLITIPSGALANITVTIDRLGDGSTESMLLFPAPGTKNNLQLTVQTGLRSVSARLGISGYPYTAGGTDAPFNPSLDVGDDGDVEWKFNGTGYGLLGLQNVFSDGGGSPVLSFGGGGGFDTTINLRIPYGAVVSSAALDIQAAGFTGEGVNVSFDLGGDNLPDWTDAKLSNVSQISGFTTVLNAYLSSAQVSGNDSFGNNYIDVPVKVGCNDTADLTLFNLSIPYDCTVSIIDFSAELNSRVPSAPGSANVSVPLAISVESAGKIKLSQVRIQAHPPVHSPELQNPLPASGPSMDENSTITLSIQPRDIYNNPVSLQWYVDANSVPGANYGSFDYRANYSSAGVHSVSVTANNTLAQAQHVWAITVRNVNRPPVLDTIWPPGPATVAESSDIIFSVNASDPDGDSLSYIWQIDSKTLPGVQNTCQYEPQYGSAGAHTVNVTVSDPELGKARFSWTVTVRKSNVSPVIQYSAPSLDPSVGETGNVVFSVTANDVNGDPLTVIWTLDGYQAGNGPSFNYTPDYSSSGKRIVQALVSDGEFTVARLWNVTVTDLNRPPSAVIGFPREGDEFLAPANITLSGRSSSDPDSDLLGYRWSEINRQLGSNESLTVSFAPGRHEISLTVSDGKDGQSTARVNITIRQAVLSSNVTVSPSSPSAGTTVRITVSVTNSGDGAATNVRTALMVDGVEKESRVISSIAPGTTASETFEWEANGGFHTIWVLSGDQGIRRTIAVSPGSPDYVLPLTGAFVIAIIAGAALFVLRRKKKSDAPSEEMEKSEESRPRPRRPQYSTVPRPGTAAVTAHRKSSEPETAREDASPLLDKIVLDDAPYREKPLEIQTTPKARKTRAEAVRDDLAVGLSAKSLMMTQPPAGKLGVLDTIVEEEPPFRTSGGDDVTPDDARMSEEDATGGENPSRDDGPTHTPAALFAGEDRSDDDLEETPGEAPMAPGPAKESHPLPGFPVPDERPPAEAEDLRASSREVRSFRTSSELPEAPGVPGNFVNPPPAKTEMARKLPEIRRPQYRIPQSRKEEPSTPAPVAEKKISDAQSPPFRKEETVTAAPDAPPRKEERPLPRIEITFKEPDKEQSPTELAPTRPSLPKTPLPADPGERLTFNEERIAALEKRGIDTSGPKRFLSLSRSFFRAKNLVKTVQYCEKAETELDNIEKK